MYGLIIETVKDLVINNYGELVWANLMASAGLSAEVVRSHSYDDQNLYDVVEKASKMLNKTSEEILILVGVWFIKFIKTTEYASILNFTGNSIPEILQNINSIHGHIKLSSFPQMTPPTFRTTNVTPTSLRLHYISGKSTRIGLGPLVVGLVKGIAEYHLLWPSNQIKVVQEKYASRGADHDIFYVTWKKEEKITPQLDSDKGAVGLDIKFTLTPNAFNAAFPFHFCLNKKLTILQVGTSLQKLLKNTGAGELFTSRFKIVNPPMTKISFKEIKKQKEKEFTIHCEVDKLLLELKGQWLPALATGSSSNKTLCFVGSPMIRSSKENEQLGLSFSDFAIHDPAKDRIFALEALQASNAANRANEIKPSTSMSSTSEEITDSDDFSATTDREFTGCPSNLFLRRNSAHSACPHPLSSYSTPILLPSEFTPDKKYTPPPPPHHPTTAHNGSDKFNPSIATKYLSPSTSSDFSPSKPTSLLFETLHRDTRENFKVARMIIERLRGDANQELLIKSICSFYTNQNVLTNFFTTMIRAELNDSKNKEKQSLPFREDSTCTTVISTFLRNTCLSALRDPLRRVIMKLIASPPETPEAIVSYLMQFIQNLSKSTSSWPTDAVELLKLVQIEYSRVGNELSRVSSPISSLFFLRLLGPMIASPERHLITTQPLDEYRESLALISKLMINMALGIKFEADHKLANYNSFLTQANQRSIFQFVDQLLEPKHYVPNTTLIESDFQNMENVRDILFAKSFESVWPLDDGPSSEMRSFFQQILSSS